MRHGYLAIVLHTHLPFVRHPEHDRPLEERWLHEALIECYLPLLGAFDRLVRDGVPFALTMSLTPPLAAMLRDELLQRRFEAHLSRLRKLAAHEAARVAGDAELAPVVRFYERRLAEVSDTWQREGGDIVRALARHARQGRIELITASATHAYLPGLTVCPSAQRAQLRLGVRAFEHLVGHRPLGMWLPECAFDPAFEPMIAEAGVRFTVLDAHGLLHATPRPAFDAVHPILSPSGIAFFARDERSSEQVWSREVGYPGNPYYRDFYRDIGFDLPEDRLHGEVGPFGARVMTGLKYHRITGRTDKKLPYQPGVAERLAESDALDFVRHRERNLAQLSATMPVPPVIVAPYDTELFGHWWFEGPLFLEHVFRQMHRTKSPVTAVTLRGYLEQHPTAVVSMPAASSWGAGGYGEVWVGREAAQYWRHVHHASRTVERLVADNRHAQGPRGDALDQAIRELLLLQTSDWPFILKTGSMVEYAEARLRAHFARLTRLSSIVTRGPEGDGDLAWLADVRERDNFIAGLAGEALRSAFDPPAVSA